MLDIQRWHTRGDISHTVWDVCCEPIVAFHIHQRRSPRLTTERHSATLTCILAPDQWVCREASELPLVAPVNAERHNTYVSSLLLLLRVFRDSTAHGASPSHPSTRGTPGIPLSGPVEGSELEFLCIPKPIWPFVTAVTCAALHPVRRASCTSKIFLSMYWTCFSFRCTQKIRKKTRPTAPWSSTIRVQVSGRFPCLDVFKVETGNQVHDSTAPVISLLEAALHFANTSKPLSIRRSLTSCRASSSESGLLKHGMPQLKLFLMCSRLAVPLTAHASPAHLWSGFLRAWSKIGHFERSSSRCGQPTFWSHAHVEK